ncbi:hypothetical protein ACFE04_006552 [Oxalis oulophora]
MSADRPPSSTPPSQPPPPPSLPAAQPSTQRLRLKPKNDHVSENYNDLRLDFGPQIFTSLEKYLPPTMLSKNRNDKLRYMKDILAKYLPHSERVRGVKLRDYRHMLMSNYQPLHRGIYYLQPVFYFAPSFLKAISDNTEESFRRVMSEPSPGVFTFEIFNRQFCDTLIAEVENFEKWVDDKNVKILRPNTMNNYGTVLDDIGFETMLNKLVDQYISPIAKVFYPEVGGTSLDSHHGFIVEYGEGKDTDLGFHVDDAEVTLNVCLGKQFSGGDLYFRGTRCDKHVNTSKLQEEIFDYAHVPGQAVLHRGRLRHGVRATTSGRRINLLVWCKSSFFREMIRYHNDFSLWCEQCLRDKKEKQQLSLAAAKLEIFGMAGDSRKA